MRRRLPLILAIVVASIYFWYNETSNQQRQPDADTPRKELQLADISYQGKAIELTRHGTCRMDCRKIDFNDIQLVLEKGEINTHKNRPDDTPCPTFAHEGKGEEGRNLRVIVADCPDSDKPARIVTVIDLDNEHDCSCK